jgi:hypothetical protein
MATLCVLWGNSSSQISSDLHVCQDTASFPFDNKKGKKVQFLQIVEFFKAQNCKPSANIIFFNHQAAVSKGKVPTIHAACLGKSGQFCKYPNPDLNHSRYFCLCPYQKPRRNPDFKHYPTPYGISIFRYCIDFCDKTSELPIVTRNKNLNTILTWDLYKICSPQMGWKSECGST